MANKKAQTNFEEIWKAIITAIIGIIFLKALAPIASPVIGSSLFNVGIFLILAAVIIALISLILQGVKEIQDFFSN